MARGHHGGGWRGNYPGFGYGVPVVPDYAVIDYGAPGAKSSCGCSGSSSTGMLAGLESAVKQNPIAVLLGVLALGYVLGGKKGRF